MKAVLVASRLLEAAVGPSQAQLDELMEIILLTGTEYPSPAQFEEVVNQRLADLGVRFDANDVLLRENPGSPGRADENGGVVLRTPAQISPQTLQPFRYVLSHEGVHLMQMDAAERTGSVEKMFKSAHDRMMPGGKLDWGKYMSDPHEVMAYARSLIDRYRMQGINRRRALQHLRTDPALGQMHGAERNRFLKHAYAYTQDLPEALQARIPWIKQQFPGITDEEIQECAKQDPTAGTYTAWIIKQKRQSGLIGWANLVAGEVLKPLLRQFDQAKQLPTFQGSKDINTYHDYYALNHALEINKDIKSNRQLKRELVADGERTLGEIGGMRLVQFTNADAAMAFSHNSRLCTVGRDSAEEYVADGLYGIFVNNRPYLMIDPSEEDWRTMDDQALNNPIEYAIIRPLTLPHQNIIGLPIPVSGTVDWEQQFPEMHKNIDNRMSRRAGRWDRERNPEAVRDPRQFVEHLIAETQDPDDPETFIQNIQAPVTLPNWTTLSGRVNSTGDTVWSYQHASGVSFKVTDEKNGDFSVFCYDPSGNYWTGDFIRGDNLNDAVQTAAAYAEDALKGYIRRHARKQESPLREAQDPDDIDPYDYIEKVSLRPELDRFSRAYVEAALWSTNDNSDPETGGEPLDQNYDESDIEDETLQRMHDDCQEFQRANAALLDRAYAMRADYDECYAGHDLWLTANHHGSGFWDSGLDEVGIALTNAADALGQMDLTIGDDGLIYGQ